MGENSSFSSIFFQASLIYPAMLLASIGNVLRKMIRALMSVYYSKIEITNPQYIPTEGSLLIVANHPNSLIDPAIIGIAVQKPVHFLAKAPLFDIPVLGPIMHALGMMPAYRGSDDRSQVRRNVETLQVAAEHLAKGETVALFPEGKSHDLIRVEQVRSGAGRIAMQAIELGTRNLKILPVGINFERKEKFRSEIWVQIGEPIDANKWLADHNNDSHAAMRQLTTKIDECLKSLAIHLNESQWEIFLTDLEVLVPAASPQASDGGVERLRLRKRIADAINYYMVNHPARSEPVVKLLHQYREQLTKAGINIRSALLQHSGLSLFIHQAVEIAWIVLLFIPALVGTIFHLFPFVLVRGIVPFIKGKGQTTIALSRLGLGFPIYFLWYGVSAWAMVPWIPLWSTALFLGLLPFCGVLALEYWLRVRQSLRLWWNEFMMLVQPRKLEELRKLRNEISLQVQQLASEYSKSMSA
jgi:1-acyl-sn-glycerol-3-phosphate acyltransferase